MSTQALSTGGYGPLMRRSLARAALTATAIVTVVFALAAGPTLVRNPSAFLHAFPSGTLHAPDFAPIAHASPVIQVHLATILVALVTTAILLSGVKGSRLHRVLGWTWAVAMVITATAALFIKATAVGPRFGPFGILHVFAVLTLVSVPRAVLAARRHDVAGHAATISGFVVGALGIAGLAAFLPGRLMWAVFFG